MIIGGGDDTRSDNGRRRRDEDYGLCPRPFLSKIDQMQAVRSAVGQQPGNEICPVGRQ